MTGFPESFLDGFADDRIILDDQNVHCMLLALSLWRRRVAFLSEGIDGDDPVAPRLLGGVRIDKVRIADRLQRQARHRLARAVDARRLHAIDAIAADASLRVSLPEEMALRSCLLGK